MNRSNERLERMFCRRLFGVRHVPATLVRP